MNFPFNLVHIKRYRLIVYATLRNISIYSIIKQITDVIKRTTYALDKLEIGESSKYATLAMKDTILDKDDITLPRRIEK
jgi:DNA replication protein DnaD